MTFRNDDMQDAELEDFLQGKGELASLLRDLPQAQPSAELDAAIIAQAERALAASTPAIPTTTAPAANDATGPEGHGKPPSFLWRWKLPLSLAASILFAIPVVMQQNQQPYSNEPVIVAAPNAPVPQAKDNAALPELAQADMAKQDKLAAKAEATPAPAAATAPVPTARVRDAAPPVMEASKAKESKDSNDARLASAAKTTGELKRAEQPAEPVTPSAPPPPVMVAAAPEPARVTVTGSAIRRQEVPAAAAPATNGASNGEEKPVADNQYASNAKMRAPSLGANSVRAEAAGTLAKTSEAEARSPAAIADKPVQLASRNASFADANGNLKAESASAEKKAGMPAAAPFPAAQPVPRIVMAAPPVNAVPPPATTATVAPEAPETLPGAHDWLQKIEQLLKKHRNKEALEEWRKFRAIYPGFVVDASLQKQIDALQK